MLNASYILAFKMNATTSASCSIEPDSFKSRKLWTLYLVFVQQKSEKAEKELKLEY